MLFHFSYSTIRSIRIFIFLVFIFVLHVPAVLSRPYLRSGSVNSLPLSKTESSPDFLKSMINEPALLQEAPSSSHMSEYEFKTHSKKSFNKLKGAIPKPLHIETDELSESEKKFRWIVKHNKKKNIGYYPTVIPPPQAPARKNESCEGMEFIQEIKLTGCRSHFIKNRYCHGTCASFYFPKLRSKKLKSRFQSCAMCFPTESERIQVRLKCPDRAEKEVYENVIRVKKCACRNINFNDDTLDYDY